MNIEGKELGKDSCFIISEIGHNHGGNLDTAITMIQKAAACGADAVKLQKRENRSMYTKAFFNTPYNSEQAYGPTYGLHREALEFDWHQYGELQQAAKDAGIILFATAFDQASVDFCVGLGMPAIKIASGDLIDVPLLKYAAATQLPVFLSTGGGHEIDVDRAVEAILEEQTTFNLCVMQCTAIYPAPFEKLNLSVIQMYRQRYPQAVVGVSLHDTGISMAMGARALGAMVMEKHFTLNRASKGTDHAFSLEPHAFAKMVKDLRRLELAIGDGHKTVYPEEEAAVLKMGKSLYAATGLRAGHILDGGDLVALSPGGGIPPYAIGDLVGKVLLRDVQEEEQIDYQDIALSHDRAV